MSMPFHIRTLAPGEALAGNAVAVAARPDGRQLAVAAGGDRIRFWSLAADGQA